MTSMQFLYLDFKVYLTLRFETPEPIHGSLDPYDHWTSEIACLKSSVPIKVTPP